MGCQASFVSSLHIYRFINLILLKLETTPLRIIMENSVNTQLEILTKRLAEAERRAKLLKLEVKNIRSEISLLQQNVTVIKNNSNSEASGTYRNSTVVLPNTVLNIPSTSRVDGLVSNNNKRPSNENDPTQNKKIKGSFIEEGDYVVVYTDGACENNGKPNAKAGIGVWFGKKHPLNISEPVNGRATNNTAEIQACVQALLVAKEQGIEKIKIYTDSQFTISCITNWIKNWKRNNWRTYSGGDVKNKTDLQVLDDVVNTFQDVQWVHVVGHAGIEGNEEADKLAREGAIKYKHKATR